jgi:biopolymer transport protein ExbD
MADVAFLLVVLFAALALFSAPKGIGMRFAGDDDPALPPADETTVWVAVAADGTYRVDGRPVAAAALVDAMASGLARRPGATLVLHADPAAEFGAFVGAYDRIAGARRAGPLGGVRLAVPSRDQVEAWLAVEGRDPFEGRP